jgi:hypothetical protein
MGVIYILEKTIFMSNSLIAVYNPLQNIMFVLYIIVLFLRVLRASDVLLSYPLYNVNANIR